VILPLQGRYRPSERRPLKLRLVLLIVTALLVIEVVRDNPEIDHPHVPLVVHSEVIQLYVLVQQFRLGVQQVDRIEHLQHKVDLVLRSGVSVVGQIDFK
jgi:hypothetical protein